MDHLDKLNTLNNYIRIYDNVLPTATLNKFLKICENNKIFFSPGGIVSDTVEGSVNKKVRNTLVWDLANSEAEESKTNVHWCNLWICLFGNYLKRYEKEILEKELHSIRKQKKKNKLKPVKKHLNIVFKIGDKVRIEGSTTVGIIDNIEKNNAIINYDTFTTKTNISKLEFVK